MPEAKEFPIKVCDALTATIPISDTTSGAVDMYGATLAGIIMPAAFTGTAISFTVSDTLGGTYVALKDTAGNAISLTVSASSAIGFEAEDLKAWRFLKVVSNATELAARAIKLIPRVVP